MGTPETSPAKAATTAPRIAPPGRATPPRFDPALACALLEGADVDAGLRYVVQGLEQHVPAPTPAWHALVAMLAQIPFVAAARESASTRGSHARAIDLLLGTTAVAEATPFGIAGHEWFRAHSAIARALRRRTAWLASRIDEACADPNARIVGLYAGHAPELFASEAARSRRAGATLLDYDADVLRALRARPEGVAPERCPLADVLGGRWRAFDCALVYAPSLASRLPATTVGEVVAVLATWLRPGGRLVLPMHTSLHERAFLAHVANWRPNAVRPERVLRDPVAHADFAVRVEHDATHALAYLELERLR